MSVSINESGPSAIKLDGGGLPLIPQPTNSPTDPLNYPNWLKYAILGQVSLLAFVSTLNVAIINPAVVPLAKEFDIPPVTATYQTTVAIGVSALGPLVFTPFANVYGRRPAYLISVLIGFATAVGSATATSYGRLVGARIFNGFGPSAAQGLGAGTVVDLFYGHQRGRAMGIFTLMSTNGAHLAPLIGGYVARDRGWRWCFWVGAIVNGIIFLVVFFCMPETLFDRPDDFADQVSDEDKVIIAQLENISTPGEIYRPPPMTLKTYFHRMWFWDLDKPTSRQVKAKDFGAKPLSMLKYPSVFFPALYYALTYGFASIEPAVTLATLFSNIYKFDTVQNGLANGLSLLIGASLGELCSGSVTDAIMRRARKRALERGDTVAPEVRLQGIWTGAILAPIGLLMYGVTIHFATTFVAPCIGMAIACIGTHPAKVQIVTSVCYTYSCGDCYRHRSNDVSLCFNFFRQIFGMTVGFYSIPLGERIGFEWSSALFAAICIVSFFPIVVLMYHGPRWRMLLGEPSIY
ncbi:hypothetical protein HYPSUDRAFT_211467 [Hypholoma sublateritium FD-334 SS-4]|uniref:Major facilitator superfamily (MFS) profile domain-containing protein n=1 Tax=Hypholoma sublateritium (strain FD-334 SS-4) TaxID=945553 RepID=A0A0D2LLI1_HYPSF|nr:hypothetical protein HYPSUDRAFT_211467 [Hypholoma sublateritium FD-334 SS-4]